MAAFCAVSLSPYNLLWRPKVVLSTLLLLVPHTTFLLMHVCFLFYHVMSSMTLQRLRHSIADLPEKVQWVFEAAWILAQAHFIAWLETIAISNFPCYQFVDRASMYKVRSFFYAIYFLVSFLMFLR
ncbi:hypothetical protein FEM48_ZijujUnG0114800 [Ziziphus jujuba var. spinosa]|uniref:Uncharacterized protein n=1 Tax=Ziziphus jujuba var. spinosa TaxID=714518 RepID=A0A978U7Z1_ZIZJJ|nr:hypothetical protein FEM48_ZijujUnG0114800 [Ziziphus jujuba var. spinosa]